MAALGGKQTQLVQVRVARCYGRAGSLFVPAYVWPYVDVTDQMACR
jgi:hypothetical protein